MTITAPHSHLANTAPVGDQPAARWREAKRLQTLHTYDLLDNTPQTKINEINKMTTQN